MTSVTLKCLPVHPPPLFYASTTRRPRSRRYSHAIWGVGMPKVVVNSAGAYIRPLAGICLDVMEALDIPVCLNLYITAAGQKTSAPPHTDKQDVFVMQTQVLLQ